jgi:hypothetical protein
VVGQPGILFECARGRAGTLALSQHVGLPLSVSVRGHSFQGGPGVRTSRSKSERSLDSALASQVQPGPPQSKTRPINRVSITAGSFENVVIDRPGDNQADRLRRDPDFIRAWASGVLLVKLGARRSLHRDVHQYFAAIAKGWSVLNMAPTLRVARYIAGLAITSPGRVISVWGQTLRACALNPPNQLFWLRQSQKLPWDFAQGTPLHCNSSSSLRKWLEETSKSRETLDTVIRTSIHAKRGLGLICEDGTLPEFRGRNCPLACYGSRFIRRGRTVEPDKVGVCRKFRL